MTDLEVDAIIAGITDAVLGHVRKELASVFMRLDAYDKALPVMGPPGPAGAKGLDGAPGTRGEPGPQGENGVDGQPGLPGPQGLDGQPGQDGRDGVDGKDGADGLHGKDGADGLRGKDGADGLIGPQGIPGRDGQPGVPGPMGEKGLDGKDGRDGLHGKDGLDGFGFDDLSMEYDGERTFTFTFQKGDRVKSFPFTVPLVLDRGVFSEGKTYQPGDAVTWGGSFYVAQKATAAKPGLSSEESRCWRLTVKRGSDGKAGAPGPEGPRGPRGEVVTVPTRY